MHNRSSPPSPPLRVLLALLIPAVSGLILHTLYSAALGAPPSALPEEQGGASLLLAGAGGAGLLLGWRWYGFAQLGLRGGRPLYSSIGFATLGWVVIFIARLVVVSSNPALVVSATLGRDFIYLLLFEALALQLWAFGLLFRAIAGWRGPLTAAIGSGLLFGVVAYLLFDEAFVASVQSLLFFLSWGIFYGLIRLRTGSILGTVIIQAMQSLTTWYILLPELQPVPYELGLMYAIVATFFVLFIWRLWPKQESDYRV